MLDLGLFLDYLEFGIILSLENSAKLPNVRKYILVNRLEAKKARFNPNIFFNCSDDLALDHDPLGTEGILALATDTYMGIWL